MYNEQQIQAYLNRLHYNKEITLTREVLDDLIYAHQCSISFENLDVYDFQKEISLTEEALYDKFIVQRIPKMYGMRGKEKNFLSVPSNRAGMERCAGYGWNGISMRILSIERNVWRLCLPRLQYMRWILHP